MATMIWGTAYFVSLAAACRYYKPYGCDAAHVGRKLTAGEIHIGAPLLKKGERLLTIDEGTRYAIEATDV